MNRAADLIIIGGGTGGVAAALAATALGARVILTEETDWLGGQLTSQAVPPDEHPWIEQFGCTRSYRRFRDGVRQYYRDHYPLTAGARFDPRLNPGGGTVSRLCHEPRVGGAVIEALLAPARSAGLLDVRLRHRPVAADVDGDRVLSVTVESLDDGERSTLSAPAFLDATELGDLLPLTGTEWVTGAESADDTGEPHAVSGPAQPDNVQAFTWCFPMAFDPEADAARSDRYLLDPPPSYGRWRDGDLGLNPPWPGPLLSWWTSHPHTCEPRETTLFAPDPSDGRYPLWLYRRLICSDHHAPGAMPHEATLVNWPQNDYLDGNLIGASAEDTDRYLRESRELSLSLLCWLQREAPRHDGGVGYPGLHLRPDLVGTAHGLAMAPYVRESRRIRPVFRVLEQHVGTEARAGRPAEVFDDSVGVGCYRIDLHPSTGRDNYIDVSSQPFQIPLGALLPERVDNLLPACKNLGVTHITNGCYRLHPVEWNIGEASALLAVFAHRQGVPPRAVREDPSRLAAFQGLLRAQGVEPAWPRLRPV